MTENELTKFIIKQLETRFKRIGFIEKYLLSDFNLVQTGILDSMQFIELISLLEKEFKIELDFENELPGSFTTLSGLVRLALKSVPQGEWKN
jgi:acyl carrier protein